MNESYDSPKVLDLGTVEDLTAGLDKVGSVADIFTQLIPDLDGDIRPD